MVECIECHEVKSPDDFYAHKAMKNGHVNVCKDCHKRRMKTRARTNPSVKEYEAKRSKTPERQAHYRANAKRWRERNPMAYKAHSAVNYAVRSGKLRKLDCEFCGDSKVHAHHRDYAKPLDVIWLCAKCHHRLHAIFPEFEGKNKQVANG